MEEVTHFTTAFEARLKERLQRYKADHDRLTKLNLHTPLRSTQAEIANIEGHIEEIRATLNILESQKFSHLPGLGV